MAVSKDEILEQGKMIIDEGWYKWLAAGVDYIFHYEAFMKNKEKVITEMLHKLDISGFTAKECIEVSDEWLRNNPRHASNNGIINGWKDVFSPTQEQLIIDENHNSINFNIDPFRKKCLLEGLDDIAITLTKNDKIQSFESDLSNNYPWII